jgi:2-dehydro-3-deoxyphosphogluconate aldolase / (4S)-4-hydroxy-2-oxoglutarate aldolase
MIDNELASRLNKSGVIAVITINDASQAVPLARALLAGGVGAIELTLRTPAAPEAIRRIVGEVPEMIVGAGTVLTADQALEMHRAGVAFGVAPGFNPDVVKAAADIGLPFAPGVMTPSEIEGAVALGNRVLKFYHAGLAGGVRALHAICTPYAHLGLQFIPLGGVSQENLSAWVAAANVLAVGGSWIAPSGDIDARAWETITARAAAAVSVTRAQEE